MPITPAQPIRTKGPVFIDAPSDGGPAIIVRRASATADRSAPLIAEEAALVQGSLAPLGVSDTLGKPVPSALIKPMADSVVMGTPPTFTIGGSGSASVIASSVLKDATSPEFKYINAKPVVTNPVVTGMLSPLAAWGTAAVDAANSRMPYFVAFAMDCNKFEFYVRGDLCGYRLWVNGQLAAAARTQIAADFGKHYVLVDFTTAGGRARRDFVLEMLPSATLSDGLYFGGVTVEPTAVLLPPTRQSSYRIAVVSDSYGEGAGATEKSQNWLWRMGRKLGFDDVWSVSAGGTGILADNGALFTTYAARFPTDLYPLKPNLVIIQGSVNDYVKTGGGSGPVRAATVQTIQAIQQNLPGAKIIMTGVLYPRNFNQFPSSATQVIVAHNDYKLAAADCGVDFIDTQSPAAWTTGTGRVGATTSDGPADLYCFTDGVHPSQAGHDHLADRMAIAVAQILGLSVS